MATVGDILAHKNRRGPYAKPGICKGPHPSITLDAVMAAVERSMWDLEMPGFCVQCGEETEGVEPDARWYRCEGCGEKAVFGAEELLLHMAP